MVDARVLLVGDAESGLAEALVDLGARTVHVYDPVTERASRASDAESSRGLGHAVTYRALADDIDVRDGAFDVAIVSDLGWIDEPSLLARKLRRLVSADGAVLVVGRARMPSGTKTPFFPELREARIEYAELYDVFALQFEHVTLAGMLPFEGVVFAELGTTEELAVSVDTRHAPDVSPDVFVLLASRHARALDPYAIVQVPSLAPSNRAPVDDRPSIEALVLRAERAEAQIALQSADLAHLTESHARDTALLEDQLRERAGVVANLERELARREQLVKELVASLEEAREGSSAEPFEAPIAAHGADPEEIARLERKLDDLAFEMARREGELVARAWTIAELETKLSRATATSSSASTTSVVPDAEVDHLRDELDALRQALTQEHAARLSVEAAEREVRAERDALQDTHRALVEELRARTTDG